MQAVRSLDIALALILTIAITVTKPVHYIGEGFWECTCKGC